MFNVCFAVKLWMQIIDKVFNTLILQNENKDHIDTYLLF